MDRVSAFIFIECMMTQVHQKSHSLRIPHIYNWPSATPANSSGHYFTERNGTVPSQYFTEQNHWRLHSAAIKRFKRTEIDVYFLFGSYHCVCNEY